MTAERPLNQWIEELLQRLRDDSKKEGEPRLAALYDDNYIEAVDHVRADNIAYSDVIDRIQKITKTSKKDLRCHFEIQAADLRAKQAKPKEESELSKRAKAEARTIVERGETYDFICKVWQSRVKGNQALGQALVVSRGVQSCLNTRGLHIYAHGKHGQGKSHGNDVMISLLPADGVKDGNISPKVLYYMQRKGLLLPGTTIYLDDLDLNGPLADMFKKVTTKFQNGAQHRVVLDGEVFELKLPPRTAIWTTSVDFQGDEQFRDRFLDIEIDENQTLGIIEFMKQKDSECHNDDQYAFETAVCQELFGDLANRSFIVEIPFANRIRFPESENTRGYAIFSDMIKGLAALRYFKRKMSENGHLVAELDDFRDAKTLYEALAGHGDQKFSGSEKAVLKALMDLGYTATIDQLHEMTNKSTTRLRDLFNGRGDDEQKRRGGLLAKCAALKVERETILEDITEGGHRMKRSKPRNLYALDRSFRLTGGALITLDGYETGGSSPNFQESEA